MWVARRNLWRAPTPKVRMILPTLKHPHANILMRESMVGTCLVRPFYEDDHILHPTPIFCYCERTQVQIDKATLHSYLHHHTFYKSESGHHTELVKTPLHRKEGPVPTSILIRGIRFE